MSFAQQFYRLNEFGVLCHVNGMIPVDMEADQFPAPPLALEDRHPAMPVPKTAAPTPLRQPPVLTRQEDLLKCLDTISAASKADLEGLAEVVLWNDPASGVWRHADAGYPDAIDCARRSSVRLPELSTTSVASTRPSWLTVTVMVSSP